MVWGREENRYLFLTVYMNAPGQINILQHPKLLRQMPPPHRRDRALSSFLDSLKLLKEVSELTPVPFLKGAVGTALRIGEIIQVRRGGLVPAIPLTSTSESEPKQGLLL
jgi:hypothetical protein